jgi:hypothetical protein
MDGIVLSIEFQKILNQKLATPWISVANHHKRASDRLDRNIGRGITKEHKDLFKRFSEKNGGLNQTEFNRLKDKYLNLNDSNYYTMKLMDCVKVDFYLHSNRRAKDAK